MRLKEARPLLSLECFLLLPAKMADAAPDTPPHPELQYLNLVRDIIAKGTRKSDRTGS